MDIDISAVAILSKDEDGNKGNNQCIYGYVKIIINMY